MKMHAKNQSATLCQAAALFFFVCAAYAGVKFTPEETKTLADGKQVIQFLPSSGKDSVIAGSSFIVIDAPVDKVWAELVDVSNWSKIFPNTFACNTVASKGNSSLVKMKLGNRFFTFNFFITITLNKEKNDFTYSLDKNRPNDVEETRGKVRLFAQPGGRTLVVFTTLVKVPLGAIISLMGDKVVHVMEERILSVPKSLKKRVAARTN